MKNSMFFKISFLCSVFLQVQAQHQGYVPSEAIPPFELATSLRENVARKMAACQELVEKGTQVFSENSFSEACHQMRFLPELKKGESYLSLLTIDGVSVVSHNQKEIWRDLSSFVDSFGFPVISELRSRAEAGGGWHTYSWVDATKSGYISLLEKEGKKYLLESSYFASSKAEEIVVLVKGAVSVFNRLLIQGLDKDAPFGFFGNPQGPFIQGDLYLFVLDEYGTNVVHGNTPGIVGLSSWEEVDANGVYFVQDIINRLKNRSLGTGIWVEYIFNGALKYSYAERVVDQQGRSYFIGCGYHPTSTNETVMRLVSRGYHFLKSYGRGIASQVFTHGQKGPGGEGFIQGDLNLFLISFDGTCIAYGGAPLLVGKNLLNVKDQSGRFVYRDFIETAKRESRFWSGMRDKNVFWSVYAERIEVGAEEMIIGCALFPNSKRDALPLMVSTAAGFLRNQENKVAFSAFSDSTGDFIKGDQKMFVLDREGTCYVWGNDYSMIWRNLKDKKDQAGNLYIQSIIDASKVGASSALAQKNNVRKMFFVEPVIKPGVEYAIGSGYYP